MTVSGFPGLYLSWSTVPFACCFPRPVVRLKLLTHGVLQNRRQWPAWPRDDSMWAFPLLRWIPLNYPPSRFAHASWNNQALICRRLPSPAGQGAVINPSERKSDVGLLPWWSKCVHSSLIMSERWSRVVFYHSGDSTPLPDLVEAFFIWGFGVFILSCS